MTRVAGAGAEARDLPTTLGIDLGTSSALHAVDTPAGLLSWEDVTGRLAPRTALVAEPREDQGAATEERRARFHEQLLRVNGIDAKRDPGQSYSPERVYA